MSLKAIELQIAIPKTVDAGKLAEQKQQQSQLNQDQANALTERQALRNKETVVKAEKYAKTDANKKNGEEGQARNGEQRTIDEEKKTVHPYKGSFVDFNG